MFLFAGIVRVASFDRGENGERSDFTRGETMIWANKDRSHNCVLTGVQEWVHRTGTCAIPTRALQEIRKGRMEWRFL